MAWGSVNLLSEINSSLSIPFIRLITVVFSPVTSLIMQFFSFALRAHSLQWLPIGYLNNKPEAVLPFSKKHIDSFRFAIGPMIRYR